MRKLSTEKRAMILSALAEGNSIASTCRMVGASKITVLRLLADAGTLAAQYHDLMVRGLTCQRVQVDELWSFCGCKERAKAKGGSGFGDVWTWVAIDADTKLTIGYLVGLRGAEYANAFIRDVADRIENRIQLTSDGYTPYLVAVEDTFGGDIDYAMLVKIYGQERPEEARYSPPQCIGARPEPKSGDPDPDHISTSYSERQNLTVRMSVRRFTRLTNGFSKKIENHEHAVALHYLHYNFIRKHQTIKTTPAVRAGLAERPWTMLDFVRMLEGEEARNGGRLSGYLPPFPKFSKSE